MGWPSLYSRLVEREAGALSRHHRHASVPWSVRQSHTFLKDANSEPALVRRLTQVSELSGHEAPVTGMSWNAEGTRLLSSGDDCRVKLWDIQRPSLLRTIETGHTKTIHSVNFMPDTADNYILSCSSDREIRLLNLQKQAVRPFRCHRDRVKAALPLSSFEFISAGDSGKVCLHDTRGPTCPCEHSMSFGRACANLVAHQTTAYGSAVGINALAVDPLRPYMFATGGMDTLVRLYDRRMLGGSGAGGTAARAQWVSCYVPEHLHTRLGATRREHRHVTGIAFSHNSASLAASYAREGIYSFNLADHALRQGRGHVSFSSYNGPPVTGPRTRRSRRGANRVSEAASREQAPTPSGASNAAEASQSAAAVGGDGGRLPGDRASDRLEPLGPGVRDPHNGPEDPAPGQPTGSERPRKRAREEAPGPAGDDAGEPSGVSGLASGFLNRGFLSAAGRVSGGSAFGARNRSESRGRMVWSGSSSGRHAGESSSSQRPHPPLQMAARRTPQGGDQGTSAPGSGASPSQPGEPAQEGAPAAEHAAGAVTRSRQQTAAPLTATVAPRPRSSAHPSRLGAALEDDASAGAPPASSPPLQSFQRCYKGHRNQSDTNSVALIGGRSEFVVSGSEDGNIFVWDFHTGEIVNVLSTGEHAVGCVACHPHDLVLASPGESDTVRIWSPAAQAPTELPGLDAVLLRNAQELAAEDAPRHAGPVLVSMLQGAGGPDRPRRMPAEQPFANCAIQ
eukprot:jgi/Tetstr1/428209/TSEL_018251.t1